MFGFAEIALYDYITFRKWTVKFVLSLGMSFFILILVGRELYLGFKLIRKYKRLFSLRGNEKEEEEKMEAILPEERLIIEKYTEVINLDKNGPHWYFTLMDSLRFSVIQLVIVSLQLLNRTQALIVLFIYLVSSTTL